MVDITHWDPKPNDLVKVEKMFDGFAKSDTHPGMKKKMAKVYTKAPRQSR